MFSGVHIDHITSSGLNVLCFSDACEFGLDEFLDSRKGWRIPFPHNLIGKFSLNVLEFVASKVTVCLALAKAPSARVLAVTYRIIILSWLFKVLFDSVQKGCMDQVACFLESSILAVGSSL